MLTGETTSKKTKAATKIKRSGASVVSCQPKSGSGGGADSEDGHSADNQEQGGKGILARRNKRCACVSASECVCVCVCVGLCNEASTPRVPDKRHSGEKKQTVSLHPKPLPRLSDPLSSLPPFRLPQACGCGGYSPASPAAHCKTLQHTATCCTTLQHAAARIHACGMARAHCSVNALQHSATRCNTLQHTATRCNTLQHAATRCNTLQQTAM